MRTQFTHFLHLFIILLPIIFYYIYGRQIKTKVIQKATIASLLFLYLGYNCSWLAMIVFSKLAHKFSQLNEEVYLSGGAYIPILSWIINIVGIISVWVIIVVQEIIKQKRNKKKLDIQNNKEIFQKLMTNKSDIELEEYLNKIMAYSREIIEAVIDELKIRGRRFNKEELISLETKIIERENTIGKSTITVRNYLEKNIVEDSLAIALYSRKTISWITLIFGIVTGSILIVINLIITEKKKGYISVLLFCVLYLTFEIIISSIIPNKTAPYINFILLGLNGFGAVFLHTTLWNKFIGNEIKYRNKSLLVPIILGIILEGLFFIIWINI